MIFSFFFNDTATTKIYTDCHTLSLRDALPIYLLIVVPVALLIADLMFAQTGHYYVGEAKARHLLEDANPFSRSEEHTSELQSLMRISYAVFCLKKKKKNRHQNETRHTRYNVTKNTTESKCISQQSAYVA